MNSASAPAPSVPFDLLTVSGGGHRPATALDLDTMARIAEEAGRDAGRMRETLVPLDAGSALAGVPSDDGMLGTATRLYRACRSGATDFASD